MALYSGALKTDIIDDTSFSQSRCEFRLPEGMYFSNMRLANLGIKSTADQYNKLAGCYGAIKRITLLDGSQVLDELVDANRYLAFDNLLAENAYNRDYKARLSKAEVGFRLSEQKVILPGGHPNAAAQDESQKTSATGAKSNLGTLDVRRALPLLNKLNILDNEMVFKNLKLVIEWESDKRNKIVTQTVADDEIVEPILLVDEIVNDDLKAENRKNMKNVVWNAIEKDIIQVPDGKTTANALADTATAEQATNRKINGFDSKLVSRMVIMKAFTDKSKDVAANAVVGNGSFSSRIMHNEKVNMALNGKRVFSGDGLKGAGKLRLMADTWGDVNIAPFDASQSVGLDKKADASTHSDGARPIVATNQNPHVGQGDYIGLTLGDRVNNLELNYERTLVKDTEPVQIYNEGLDLHMYAEVSKTLIMGKDGYQVRYN